MTSDKKVINYKVVLIEIYNFNVGGFAIRGHLANLNFKLSKLQPYCWDPKQFQMKKQSTTKLLF
jgi:hypothetical protein